MPLAVTVKGTLTDISPKVMATASINWGDGSTRSSTDTVSGGNNTLTVTPLTHTYNNAGTYIISLEASDDTTPAANTVMQTSTIKFTESIGPHRRCHGV